MLDAGKARGIEVWELQEPATLNQVAPVQNTWYTLLDAKNCKVYQVAINIEDVNETLEAQITVDGKLLEGVGFPCNHSGTHHVYIALEAMTRIAQVTIKAYTTDSWLLDSFLIEGKSVKIEVRKTTVAGAGNLTGVAIYAIKKEV